MAALNSSKLISKLLIEMISLISSASISNSVIDSSSSKNSSTKSSCSSAKSSCISINSSRVSSNNDNASRAWSFPFSKSPFSRDSIEASYSAIPSSKIELASGDISIPSETSCWSC